MKTQEENKMKVRVKKAMLGYYKHKRRRAGEVFEISDRVHPKGTILGKVILDGKVIKDGKDVSGKVVEFSEVWMEKVVVQTSKPVVAAPVDNKGTGDQNVI
jgi:hypothetical protein